MFLVFLCFFVFVPPKGFAPMPKVPEPGTNRAPIRNPNENGVAVVGGNLFVFSSLFHSVFYEIASSSPRKKEKFVMIIIFKIFGCILSFYVLLEFAGVLCLLPQNVAELN